MNRYPRKTLLVNTFGMLGYLSCLFLWAWIGIVYLPMVLANKQVEQLLIPTPSDTPVVTAPAGPISPLAVVFAFAVTALVIVLTIVALLRAPVAIAKTGKAVTAKAADSVVPLVTHGRPLPAVEKRRLTARLIKLAKLLLIITPVAVAFVGFFIEPPLPFELVVLISGALALIAVFWFCLQYILARAFGVQAQYLV